MGNHDKLFGCAKFLLVEINIQSLLCFFFFSFQQAETLVVAAHFVDVTRQLLGVTNGLRLIPATKTTTNADVRTVDDLTWIG